jgi:ribosomal protein S13
MKETKLNEVEQALIAALADYIELPGPLDEQTGLRLFRLLYWHRYEALRHRKETKL